MADRCSVDGCDRPIRSRGWCSMHYNRWVRKGDPGPAESTRSEFADRIDRRADGCWHWIGAKDPAGYGTVIVDGRKWRAHRHIYTEAHGEFAGQLRRTCATRTCVNPDHFKVIPPRGAPCSVSGCANSAAKSGMCWMHHDRLKDTGEVGPPHRLRAAPGVTCWDHIDKAGPNGCWTWTGPLATGGYGRFSSMGVVTIAHRYVYEQVVGPIPDGLQLDHLCRNPGCVNPDHLEPVTAAENLRRAREARKRGPGAPPDPLHNGNSTPPNPRVIGTR